MQTASIDAIRKTGRFNDMTWRKYCRVFDDMAAYEDTTGYTFDDPSPEMLVDFLNSCHSIGIHSVQANLQSVRMYLAQIGKLAPVESVTAYQVDLTEGIKRKVIPSISDMYQRIRLISSPESGECLYPALTFAWMGIPLKDALKIRKDQVDLEAGIIRCNIPLTYETMNAEMRSVLKAYYNAEPQILNNNQRVIPDRDERGEFIFKMLSGRREDRGSKIQKNYISKRIPKIKEKYNEHHIIPMEMEYSDFIRSGRFARMYELECEGVDWNDQNNQKFMLKLYASERIEPNYLRYNYEAYKKAFGLK